MQAKTRVLIILAVAILSAMALIIPRISAPSEFQVSNQPLTSFQDAQNSGKPIFLEFYAKW